MVTRTADGSPEEQRPPAWLDIEDSVDGVSGRRRWPILATALVLVVALAAVVARGEDAPATVEAAASATTAVLAPPSTAVPAIPPTVPPTTTVRPVAPTRVAFFGDSVGVETDPHLARVLRDHGIEYRFDGYGGTAICDYLDEMQRTAAEFDPDVVVLLFTGNALTPCITSRAGGERGILTKDVELDLLGYAAAYDIDTAAAIDTFGDDVRVLLVGPPETRLGRSAPALVVDDLYRDHAERRANVDHVGEFELLTPGGDYADHLPCTFLEPCTVGDFVRVRSEDGGHLCPRTGVCYGGLRMALTIAAAILPAERGA